MPDRSLRCIRCEYRWKPLVANPVTCPRCKSPFWDKPRLPRQHWDSPTTVRGRRSSSDESTSLVREFRAKYKAKGA